MKRKGKIFIALLAVALLLCIAAVTLAACGDKNKQTHEHTFAEEWSHNDEYHWHAATCGHNDQMKDREEHELVWTTTTPASCEDDGVQTGTCVCGYSETKSIDAIGHDYTPSWDWDSDHSGATLVLTCGNNSTHKLTAPANVTHTDETDGCGAYIIYTATAFLLGETYTDTQRVENGAVHQYKFSEWEWEDDYSSAVAVFVCQKDKSHVYKSDPVTPQKLEEEQPSCTTNGHINYKATFEFEDETYEDEQTQVLPMSHTFEKWVYTQEPNCTREGRRRKQCSVCGEQYGAEEKVDALGHDFKTAWSYDDNEHWHKCSRCNATDDHIAHTLNDEGACTTCDFATETPANEFAFSAASNGSWMLTSYNGHRSSVVIPSQYYGQPVTAIDVEAFYNNKTMVSLTVPETVKKIESRAFSGCEKLQTVVLSSNLTSIADDAFEGCGAVENVTYPSIAIDSVPKENLVTLHITNGTVPANTYKDCAKLKSIILDAAVTEIGANAFENCAQLCDVTLNEGLTSIGSNAFANCTNITQLTVPDSVTTIGKAAFDGCSGLEQLTIPFVGGNSSATEASASTLFGYIFSEEAFEGGTRTLQHFSSSDTVVYYIPSKLANVTVTSKSLLHGAFYNCNMISEVSFGEGVTAIGAEAFFSCQNLQTVNFPEQLASLGYSAFAYCVKIEKIDVPESIQTIGKKAFDVTGWFNAQNDGAIYIQHVLYQYKGTMPADTTITIEDGTVSITAEAFLGCSNLTTLNIPSTIQTYGEKAFEGCDNITNATLPASAIAHITNINLETVEITTGKIPENAFMKNEKLEILTIGSRVYSISDSAFSGCTSLQTVNWNATNCTKAESSGYYIFKGCTQLTTVNIGEKVQSIPEYAFSGCTGITKVNYLGTLKGWCEIEFGSASANPFYEANNAKLYLNDVEVTEVKDFDGLKTIAAYAFVGLNSITTVTIPDSVTSIGAYAFYGCTGITKVNYLGTLKGWCEIEFGDYSNPLYGAKGNAKLYLNDVEVKDDVTISTDTNKIGEYAFYGLTGITSVTIPDSVTSIDGGAFSGCTGIKTATMPALAINYIPKNSLTTVTITKGDIGGSAFSNCAGLQTVTIGDGVTSIGSYAFHNCTDLQTAIIGDGVQSIGYDAFCDCTSLQTVNWNATNCTEAGDGYANHFSGCTQLATVNFGDNVQTIPAYAFYNCKGLQTVSISEGVQNIGNNAFRGCTGITKVNVSSLKSWCEIDFGDNSANPLCAADNAMLYENDVEVKDDLSIPTGTAKIGNNVFYGFTGITSVSIPDSVTSIGDYAFSGCTALKSFAVDINNATYQSKDGVLYTKKNKSIYLVPKAIEGAVTILDGCTSIGAEAFRGCTGLSEITIPDSVQSIGDYAFSGCTGLKEITISDSVTSIGGSAFSNCTGLQTVTIGDGVTSIGYDAFYETPWYNALPDGVVYIGKVLYKYIGEMPENTTINIKDGTVSISTHAFAGCTGLIEITIPDSVTSIGGTAFYGCTGITKVNYLGTLKGWCEIKFGNGSSNPLNCGKAKLYVNDEEVTEVKDLDGLESIPVYAFRGCTGLTKITIPNSVQSIGDSAFRGCTGLTKITIPNSVQSIGSYAFCDCTSLQTVTIGNGVQSIGSYAFCDCTRLQDIYYAGYATQWGKIKKYTSWDENTSYQLHYNPTRHAAASEAAAVILQNAVVDVDAPKEWAKEN